ncbi:hypothetical protein [Azospirillum brasilense]|uniref:Uncharacterized protein n=1 Tax=Azospirillum brasilense TaxID=192 RepID=A0A235H3S2_AZOBR|nr:hypothetical protein [Azospirillum brasilense]OYD80117.1 hypothetical protein CHT98_32915 [Azospirillum brasilense]
MSQRVSLHEWLNGREPLDLLDGRRFSAAELMTAAQVDTHQLTNILNKTDLELCSVSAGQGRARQFCLIDVYQIALFRALMRLTENARWAAHGLNGVLFHDRFAGASHLEELSAEADRGWCARCCESIKTAPALYWQRTEESPHFIYSDSLLLGLSSGQGPLADPLFMSGVVVNATRVLRGVDVALLEAIRRRESAT